MLIAVQLITGLQPITKSLQNIALPLVHTDVNKEVATWINTGSELGFQNVLRE